MASVKKRKLADGTARYDVRCRTPDGVPRKRTFAAKRDADHYANGVETDKVRGQFVDPNAGRVRFDEYSAKWLAQRAGLRPRTRELYEGQLRLHVTPILGALELGRMKPATIREWHSALHTKGLNPNTIAKCYRLVRSILATAVEDELLPRNPCSLRGAAVERTAERPVASIEQVHAVAEAMPERFKCLVLVAGFVGLRLGELLGLERRHVDLLHAIITVEQQEQQLADGALVVGPPKTNAGYRTLSLPQFLVAELQRHLSLYSAATEDGPRGRVFVGDKGGPVRRHVLQTKWVAARSVAGMPDHFHFHDLRHTANTLTASTGASTRELMYRMGHSSSGAALCYQHATRERDEALAKAVDELVRRTPANANDQQRTAP